MLIEDVQRIVEGLKPQIVQAIRHAIAEVHKRPFSLELTGALFLCLSSSDLQSFDFTTVIGDNVSVNIKTYTTLRIHKQFDEASAETVLDHGIYGYIGGIAIYVSNKILPFNGMHRLIVGHWMI